MPTYDTSQQLFSMTDADQGAPHPHPASSYGFDMLGLGYSQPSSPPTTTRNFTGPIDHDTSEYSQLRNYTGPIDMALLEQLQQQSEQERDPEKERSFSGSSGETLRQPSPTTDDVDRSSSVATVRQPYTPPRGAANNSRRVGGTFHTNYSLRATSGGSAAAALPSSPSSRSGSIIVRRGALDFSGVDPLDRGPHPAPANGLRHHVF
ncbi:hypothetical protein BS47DRAFT_782204 [Hydnum rufescens UP504]|uniref:Uncharacterized protein n=1 Tax=Hydnum rufescens UP504 TaxID=1448309 RepID=A0A9P6B3A6_9AGAM|nr:hypothetical protein BS47DRAFT_782204 [Hydnum rufescens UP504]